MKETVLILLIAILAAFSLFGQTTKRKKRSTELNLKGQVESPCGVKQSVEEFIEEIEVEWRRVGTTKDTVFYYRTRGIVCDTKSKTLKVWVKGTKSKAGESITTSMTRYELNCRTDQLRGLSEVEYFDNGGIKDSSNPLNPKWSDAIPDSIGEGILLTVCRKPDW